MADTDHIAIDQLGPDDAAAGLVLSTEAHWNQNEADWRFFLTKGIVFGVRDNDRRLVASAALLPYGPENAWISMVLVTASWRRRGLATKLVDTCLDVATKEGLTCWLDATPAGGQPGRYLPRCRDKGGPHLLARCHAGGRRDLRPARFHADAAIAAFSSGEFDAAEGRRACTVVSWRPRAIDRARSQRDGVRPKHAAGGIRRTPRLPAAVERRRRCAGSR